MCRTSIYPWLREFKRHGWAALAESVSQGPEPKLSEHLRQRVKRWILGKDPRQYGFDFGLWMRRIVQQLIQEKLEALSLTSVGRLLASLDVTPQKPLRRAYEGDPKAVRLWLEEVYPKLQRQAKKLGAKIFFPGGGRLSVRSALGPDLWIERPHSGGDDIRSTPKHQCDQRGQRAR